jgi:cyclopropane fatty-acyl-phospholipid synthase-like methyltransferase
MKKTRMKKQGLKKEHYWTKYWVTDTITEKENIHAKVGRTIGGVPIKDSDWKRQLHFISKNINLKKNDSLLDLGAGSGAISLPFSKSVSKVCAVDISKKLLDSIPKTNNLTKIVDDLRDIDFKEGSFSKIIFYFTIQHFTEAEVICLFEKMYKWLHKDGLIYIGDIPEATKLFDFFNTDERKEIYFNSILKKQPIIGTWFTKEFLVELARSKNFKSAKVIQQPKYFINSHYRFDLILKK